MAINTRPLQFRDYLPEVFRADEVNGVNFLSCFLQAFETLFEELQGEIEGAPGGAGGGIPDLFDLDKTPPPQYKSKSRPQEEFEYLNLNFLASWIGLPLRAEKPVDWNRRFFKRAVSLNQQRGSLRGMNAILRAWLKDDLMETSPPLLILTDLTRAHTSVNAVLQLGVTATLGVDTVLGEGAPFFFIADLITDPSAKKLRQPEGLEGLDVFQQAARALLDFERPAHTYYQLRVRAHSMQLAPAEAAPERGFPFPYAQVDVTTLLWEEPWVFTSD